MVEKPNQSFSDLLISAKAKFHLTNEEMGQEMGMKERQYIRYQDGEYDGKDIKPEVKIKLQNLLKNGPQFIRKGEGGTRIDQLEEQMNQVMADLYKIKKALNIA